MNKITYEERKVIYEKALNCYGRANQLVVAIEELAELQKVITKYLRGEQVSEENTAEEIADVTIVMEQIRLIFDCNDAVCEQMDAKIRRLNNRMSAERPTPEEGEQE